MSSIRTFDPEVVRESSDLVRHGDALSTLERGLRVLEFVSRHEGLGPKQIAAALGLPLSTTYHLVNTLLDQGYLLRVGQGELVLGASVAALVDRFDQRQDPFPELRPILADLAERSGEVAVIGRLIGRRCVLMAVHAAPGAAHADHLHVGDGGPAHTMAVGKALMARADPARAVALLRAQRLERLTDRTVTDVGRLLDELEVVRSRGWAVDNEEGERGLCCVAARIQVPADRPVAAISLAVTPGRLRTEPSRLVELVTSAARRSALLLAPGP
ncbi:MAG TPA: IclR family transcriptional regulator [Candidatus Limnocylindrales bacterium]